jgi:hypothetical protein
VGTYQYPAFISLSTRSISCRTQPRLLLNPCPLLQAWERVVALRFAGRPGEPPLYSLYCEVMARYSNLVLADAQDTILACAQQVCGGAWASNKRHR